MSATVGYEHLRTSLDLGLPPVRRPARVKPVTRVEVGADQVAIPPPVAPRGNGPLEHLLFAFKHEGMNLQVAATALGHIPPADLLSALRAAPNGVYIRTACFLWESLSGHTLEDLPPIGGPTVAVFDPERYVTLPGVRNARWRVSFNGLGSLRYCATVERTAAIAAAEASDVTGRAMAFAATLEAPLRDRALAWAYLGETRDSFAIERERPTHDKAEAFARLLRQAHERRPLSEEYLVELQNAVMTSPLAQEMQYRSEQNWLHGPARGAAGVTYVPPQPALAAELMNELVSLSQRATAGLDAITAAALLSFGFVFIHPFMDGNGRLSRFLFHHALCRSGRIADGLLLPVSMAITGQWGQTPGSDPTPVQREPRCEIDAVLGALFSPSRGPARKQGVNAHPPSAARFRSMA